MVSDTFFTECLFCRARCPASSFRLAVTGRSSPVPAAPARAQTGNAATVIPGCDGKADTCTAKFANFVNWGGHRSVSRNITLKGMRTPDIGGGKK
ncbi:MAG: phage BR0599 family protein [Verrucomicrobiales bacterium]|nr:phage BR0599 family protein [Verrucomicrobiales bacterium]